MKILFMGTPDFAVPSLARLLADGHEIVGVFTQPDKPQGRKLVLTPSPVKALALTHNLRVFQPKTLKDDTIYKTIKMLSPDLIAVVAYGKILPEPILNYPQWGCINVHGSLLPKWRGAAPIQWSIISGDTFAGVTTMKMSIGLDTGDILLTRHTDIGRKETAGELFSRLSQYGAELLSETVANIQTITATPQEESKACYAPMLSKEHAMINWSKDANVVDCLIRGLNPWPVAYTKLGEKSLKIFFAEAEDGVGTPGTVLSCDPKTGLLVACGIGALRIYEVQLEGGKRMKISDFLRGHTLQKGIILG